MITKEVIFKMQFAIQKSIKCLNNGGCIHFAYYFSKALKSANVSHKICLTNEIPIDIRYNYFEPVSHVLIYIPEIGYIDGYDFFPTKKSYINEWVEEKYKRHFKLSNKKLNNLRNNYQWNRMYSKRQNVKLEEIIKKHINDTRKSVCKKK